MQEGENNVAVATDTKATDFFKVHQKQGKSHTCPRWEGTDSGGKYRIFPEVPGGKDMKNMELTVLLKIAENEGELSCKQTTSQFDKEKLQKSVDSVAPLCYSTVYPNGQKLPEKMKQNRVRTS